MSSYQNDFEKSFLQSPLWSRARPQHSTMKIKDIVTRNNAPMVIQSCQEKGETNVHNEILLLDWSGAIIWRLDSMYGWVKSTNFNRSLVIVKSATTPSTSYDHARNMHTVETNINVLLPHIIN
mgnify:CR=1 FL=1